MQWGPPCRDSDRRQIRLFGATETWHRLGIYQVKYAELAALRTKYGQFLSRRQAAGNTFDVQTYACRPIRGSSTGYSYHSWPRATDIRPAFNALRDDGLLECDYTRFGLIDGVRFVGAFLAAGFDWGGTWDDTDGDTQDEKVRLSRWMLLRIGHVVRDGRVDAMHFELDDDADIWTREETIRRLRRYRRRHPRYVRSVLEAARARDLGDLVDRWTAGQA